MLLILAIIVVGNFLRDGKSNYLEGALCILVYIIIGKLILTHLEHSQVTDKLESCCRLVLPESDSSRRGSIGIVREWIE